MLKVQQWLRDYDLEHKNSNPLESLEALRKSYEWKRKEKTYDSLVYTLSSFPLEQKHQVAILNYEHFAPYASNDRAQLYYPDTFARTACF